MRINVWTGTQWKQVLKQLKFKLPRKWFLRYIQDTKICFMLGMFRIKSNYEEIWCQVSVQHVQWEMEFYQRREMLIVLIITPAWPRYWGKFQSHIYDSFSNFNNYSTETLALVLFTKSNMQVRTHCWMLFRHLAHLQYYPIESIIWWTFAIPRS